MSLLDEVSAVLRTDNLVLSFVENGTDVQYYTDSSCTLGNKPDTAAQTARSVVDISGLLLNGVAASAGSAGTYTFELYSARLNLIGVHVTGKLLNLVDIPDMRLWNFEGVNYAGSQVSAYAKWTKLEPFVPV